MHPTIQKINELLQKVETKVNALVNKINGLLDKVPGWLDWAVDKFQKLWDKAVEKLGEFWDLIVKIVANLGVPWELNNAKDDWEKVGSKTSTEVATANEGTLQTDDADKWSGTAKDSYVKALADQKAALKGIKATFTDKIQPALDSAATAIYIFWGALVVAIGVMIIGIVTATGEAVSILGLPAVPPTVIVAVVACIGAIITGTLVLRGALSTASTTFNTLKGESGDYPNNWPVSAI